MWSFRNRLVKPLGRISVSAVGAGAETAPAEDTDRAFNDALARAMRLLAKREHGRAELHAKLVARGVEADNAHRVLDKLRDEGLQSEERFAAALVRRRVERGYGPVYIRGELRERRVVDEVAGTEMSRTDEFWSRLAAQALAKKFPPGNEPGAAYNARARFLARRGFPADIVYRALNAGPEGG